MMTALFWDFFEVTISASIVICLTLLLRLFTRRVPKTIVCILWAIVFIRLLLPFQIESPLSLQANTSAVLRNEVQFAAEEQAITHLVEAPQQAELVYTPIRIDFGSVASLVWLIGVGAMALYMVISYIRLRHLLRNAVVNENDVFITPGLNTAFLFGYFSPRIYLPVGMDSEEAALVIAHERAHLKRGDGWLKLLGFIALSVHWYNPLVWFAYVLLCKDIETACDEYVIRNMSEAERKAYASALLVCNGRRGSVLGNPVAFAEDNVKKRIIRVLDYRKPALWISVVAVVIVLLVSVFVLPNAIGPKHPQYYNKLISVLGQPLDKACKELDIPMEDLVEINSCRYRTPLKAKYAGVVFEVHINLSMETKNVDGFGYYNEYHQNREKAVKDAYAVINRLIREFGNGENNAEQLENLTEDSINTLFDNIQYPSANRNVLRYQWDLTNSGDKNITDYLNELSETKQWQDALKYERLIPAYRVEFVAYNEHIYENADVGIYYGSSYKKVDETEDLNWWDKFLNWLE